jgi:hypothetical protein
VEKRLEMVRHTFVRAIFAAVLFLVIAPGTALAAKPVDRFHDHFTDSFSDNVCGIDVNVDLVGTDNFFVYNDGAFKDTSSIRFTYTNPSTGKSVVLSSAGQISGPPAVVDSQAGTITFLMSYKGLPEKIATTHGPVLTRDAGIITFADTFDLATGAFISSTTIVHGPHPEADSDFALFCTVITEALT